MIKLLRTILIVGAFSILHSCSSPKDVIYFQDIDQTVLDQADSIFQFPIIQINDIIGIEVSALNPVTVAPFRRVNTDAIQAEGPDEYLVHADGTIQFPVLGKLQVSGLRLTQLRDLLTDSISKYVANPIVDVRILNTKFTVLGSVNNPGTYTIPEETITLLQAIGLAGDFSITGNRHNVLLIRQVNGNRSVTRIDFTQSDWLNSAFYYIRQNDVLYVEPNYSEIKEAGIIGDISELLRALTVITTTTLLFTNLR